MPGWLVTFDSFSTLKILVLISEYCTMNLELLGCTKYRELSYFLDAVRKYDIMEFLVCDLYPKIDVSKID